jgi:hypothetical protein
MVAKFCKCQKCNDTGFYYAKLRNPGGQDNHGFGIVQSVECDIPGCSRGIVDIELHYKSWGVDITLDKS